MDASAKMRTFFAAMWPTFFIRVRPASRNANPACMNITRTAARTTQMVLEAIIRSLLDTALHLLEQPTRAVVDDVVDLRLPAEPVAGVVPAARGVADGVLHGVRDLVADEERQHRLRQEPALEDAPAVLVGDPALPAVADRLDDGDPDVPGRLLDRVDHRLDPFPDHHRLHLHHSCSLRLATKKEAPGARKGLLRPRCLGSSAFVGER